MLKVSASWEGEVRPNVEFLGVIADFLAERTTLRNLHEWLARHTSWLLVGPEDSATELAAAVELSIAEIEAKHASEADLRAEIEQFIGGHSTLAVVMGVPDRTSTTAGTTAHRFLSPRSQRTASDTRLVAVFA